MLESGNLEMHSLLCKDETMRKADEGMQKGENLRQAAETALTSTLTLDVSRIFRSSCDE